MKIVRTLDERRGGDIHCRTTLNIRSGPQWREYEEIADRIAADRPRRVLDWGCGRGQMTALLRERGIEVTAFDYDLDAPELESRRLEHFPVDADVSRDPVSLPYDDAAFDAVLSCGVLEHVANPQGSVAEIRRVLEPGGTFYVYKLPNSRSYLEWIARRLGLYYHGSNQLDTLYTPATARRLLAEGGFDVAELRYANMLPLTLPGEVARGLAGFIYRFGRAMSAIPLLRTLSTNVEAIATRRA